VYDATNGTRERREWLVNVLSQQNGFKVMFVESVCTDKGIVDGNIRVCFVLLLQDNKKTITNPVHYIKQFIMKHVLVASSG